MVYLVPEFARGYCRLPVDIIRLLFGYCLDCERFTKHGMKIRLSDDSRVMTYDVLGSASSAYGAIKINIHDYVECSWRFKVHRYQCAAFDSRSVTIGLGIDAAKVGEYALESYFYGFGPAYKSYAWQSGWSSKCYGRGATKTGSGSISLGDEIEMIL